MCGRFVMIPRDVVERIVREVEQGLPPDVPDYELAGLDAFPGACVPVVVPGEGANGSGSLAVAAPARRPAGGGPGRGAA